MYTRRLIGLREAEDVNVNCTSRLGAGSRHAEVFVLVLLRQSSGPHTCSVEDIWITFQMRLKGYDCFKWRSEEVNPLRKNYRNMCRSRKGCVDKDAQFSQRGKPLSIRENIYNCTPQIPKTWICAEVNYPYRQYLEPLTSGAKERYKMRRHQLVRCPNKQASKD